MSNKRERELWIDIAKAMGIGLVMAGHTGLPIYLRSWIYLFHMPMFFFISGLWIREDSTFIKNIQRKFKAYIIPYFGYSIILSILKFLVDFNIDNIVKDVYMTITGHGSFSILWFLFALFWTDILYNGLFHILNKNKKIVCLCSLLMAVCASISNYYKIPNTLLWQSIFESLFFYSLGGVLKEKLKGKMKAINNNIVLIVVSIFAVIMTYLISFYSLRITNKHLDLANGYLGLPAVGLCGAIIGILFILSLSRLVDLYFPHYLKYPLYLVGANTIIFFPLVEFIPFYIDLIFPMAFDGIIMSLILKVIGIWICFVIVFIKNRVTINNSKRKIASTCSKSSDVR